MGESGDGFVGVGRDDDGMEGPGRDALEQVEAVLAIQVQVEQEQVGRGSFEGSESMTLLATTLR